MRISTKCSIAIHSLVFVHEYGEERRVTSEKIAGSCGVNPVTVRSIMSALRKDGIIEPRDGAGGARLAISPDEISLYRVFMCVEPSVIDKLIGVHNSPSTDCPVGKHISAALARAYERIREDLIESLRSITLRDVVNAYEAERG